MIWTRLICRNFIIFRLNTKQLLAQHIPLLLNASLPSPWNLPDDLTEPFFRDVAITPTHSHLCTFLATVEAPNPAEHIAVRRCFLITHCRQPTLHIWRCNAFFTQEPRGPSLPMINAFHFATPVHALWPLDLVMMQQFLTDVHD